MGFFKSFEILAEVAHVLRQDQPRKTVYIDVCTEPEDGDLPNVMKYPTRTTLTVTDLDLIERLPGSLAPGAIIRAKGTFQQGSYVPYKTSQIDTTFELTDVEILFNGARTKQSSQRVTSKLPSQLFH